ncbi:ABC transporter substrate-binding protein [Desmospora activa]|uniref:Carbohydrate ABC transporter substrate-binding protein (CUT1 family) n=1 Tax=Desmospora activa DSM 45169 TaxID=1121389 RepID=A0A2T4Z9K1_9BACL|nr:ABC transporter substrate-binding protein [Desmospora activa]PTM58572.1 carbohydrate ABC transporter substrate-binding protein (CUT1 family) [Desmospora activa DSM 45169]
MKRLLKQGLLLAMAAVLVLTTACGSGSKENVTADGRTKVIWWHSMGGELKSAVDHLVKEFNDSQSEVYVEAVYQGEYDESLNKLKASLGSNSGPTMVQVYEIGSRYMIDSNLITPIQTFVDKNDYDLSQLEENIIGYYTIDDQLNSMPFNTSNPILYYNKDRFEEAGLDPDTPPTTFEEVEKAAKQLTDDGNKGASFAMYGWFMEQFFANQGAELVNNGNGRDKLATQSLLSSDAGVETLTWWKKMIDDKTALNLGRKTDDTKKAFTSGQVAMTLDSTASLRGIVDSVGDKFEVGTAPLPRPKGADEGGVIVGGASLYILNNRPETEQEAAWKFIEFLTQPKQQAYWHIHTGYFPITKAAYDEPAIKENMEKFPQFQTAVDQLHDTTLNRATQGALMGVFPEARQITEKAMEEVINGQKTPEKALKDAEKEITQKIEQYNKTVKK